MLGNLHTNTNSLSLTHAQEIDDDLESFSLDTVGERAAGVRQIVHGTQIGTEFEAIVAKGRDDISVRRPRREECDIGIQSVGHHDTLGKVGRQRDHRGVPNRTDTGTSGVHRSSCATISPG